MSLEFQDSGNRTQFETGALRDRPSGKGVYVGVSPIAMKRLADRIEVGKLKYGNFRNWEKGLPIEDSMDSLLRHAYQYIEGDDTEDHLAAIMWAAMVIMHTEKTHPEMQNLPFRIKKFMSDSETK